MKEMQSSMDILREALEKSENKLEWYYVPFMEENHGTILHRSVYKAFEILNED